MPKIGRPSGYRPEFATQAEKLCRLGATDQEIADFLGVSYRTVCAWKGAHPAFMQALKAGKAQADAEVAEKLYRRALGYSHKAVKIMQYEGETIEVEYIEHYPPDTTACIFWLKNRRPDLWRDKREFEHSGTVTTRAEELSDDDLARIAGRGSRRTAPPTPGAEGPDRIH